MNILDQRYAAEVERAKEVIAANNKAKFDRSSIYDLIFPKDEVTFEKANHMAILGLRFRSHSEKDLPVQKVIAATEGPPQGVYVLPKIFEFYPIKIRNKEEPTSQIFGVYEQTLYLFIPVRFLVEKVELYAVLKEGEKRFQIGRFPSQVLNSELPGFIREGKFNKKEDQRLPDPEWVVSSVRDRYCIGVQ